MYRLGALSCTVVSMHSTVNRKYLCMCLRHLNSLDVICYFTDMDAQKFTAFLLGILAIIALGFVLDVTQTIILPFVIALLLSLLFTPIIRFLMKGFRIPRFLSIFFVIVFLSGFMFLIGWFVYSSIQSFVKEYSKYKLRLQEIIHDIINSRYLARFDIPDAIVTEFDLFDQITPHLFSISGSFANFVGVIIIVTIFLIFLFLETPHFKVKLTQAYPPHTSRRIGIMLEHITRQVSRYLGVKMLVSFLTGLSVSVTLGIIGMDFPIVWGALAFLLNFIPQIGSIIFVVVIMLMGVVQFYPSLAEPAAVTITMTALQLFFGQFLDPLMSGERLDLSPVVILLSLLFWGWLWGVVGAFIAVPIVATIKIFCANVPFLKPVNILMGTGYKSKIRLFKKR